MPDPKVEDTMPQWANKPDALNTFWVEEVTTVAQLDELHEFMKANPMPRWQFHHGPPHPSRKELDFYLQRGNPIFVVRDGDGELWAWRINTRKPTQWALWAHVRREIDELHDEDFDSMTPNSRESWSMMMAYSWALAGGPQDLSPRVTDHNSMARRVVDVNLAGLRQRALEIYNEKFKGVIPKYSGSQPRPDDISERFDGGPLPDPGVPPANPAAE